MQSNAEIKYGGAPHSDIQMSSKFDTTLVAFIINLHVHVRGSGRRCFFHFLLLFEALIAFDLALNNYIENTET